MQFTQQELDDFKLDVKFHKLQKDAKKQMEFKKFGEGQPYALLKFLVEKIQKVTPEKIEEFGDLAEQVSAPQELV